MIRLRLIPSPFRSMIPSGTSTSKSFIKFMDLSQF